MNVSDNCLGALAWDVHILCLPYKISSTQMLCGMYFLWGRCEDMWTRASRVICGKTLGFPQQKKLETGFHIHLPNLYVPV